MRPQFLGLILLLLLPGLAWAKQDPWLGPDKFQHFGVSALIGATATGIARQHQSTGCDAPWIGVSVVMLIGAAKETRDLLWDHKIWSYKDMVWNLAGGLAGSFLMARCD